MATKNLDVGNYVMRAIHPMLIGGAYRMAKQKAKENIKPIVALESWQEVSTKNRISRSNVQIADMISTMKYAISKGFQRTQMIHQYL